jgi:hypothetical protein
LKVKKINLPPTIRSISPVRLEGYQGRANEDVMKSLTNQRVLITGGSRGLGLAMAESLLGQGARVTVVARDRASLAQVEQRGATVVAGDATDAALMDGLVADIQPSVLILNAGATPNMGSIDAQTFESFSAAWNTDVRATLHGIQAALKAPMPQGSRVLLVSSGAAMVLSLPTIRPEAMRLSGGYIGAKRVIWLMAHHARGIANERGLGIHFHQSGSLALSHCSQRGIGFPVLALPSAGDAIA